MPISLSVNVTKLDKKRFFKGKKGTYCDLVLFETPESEYGDYMIKQRAKKGEKMPILGNAKKFDLEDKPTGKEEPDDNGDNDEIPF